MIRALNCLFALFCSLAVAPVFASAQTANFSLSLTDTSDNEQGFGVERKQGAQGTYAEIARTAANVATYTESLDNPAPGGVQYCYRVYAFNPAGKSGYSNEACATTPAIVVVPAAPASLVIHIIIQ